MSNYEEIAKGLYRAYITAHGMNPDNYKQWDILDQWEQGYWFFVAEWAIENIK